MKTRTRRTKLPPAALALLRAQREALENTFAGQVKQRQMAMEHPWSQVLPPSRQFSFLPSRQWRYDFAWPEMAFLLDIDGGTYSRGAHARGPGIENDREKDAHAIVMGWTVLRVTAKQVKSQRAVEWVGKVLAQKLAGDR